MILGLWDRQAEAVIDIKISEADTYSYRFEPMEALLDWWNKTKKDKHSKHCHYQQKCLFLFLISVKGILVR